MTYSEYALQFVGVKQGSTRHKRLVDDYNMIKPLPRGYRVKYSDNWCATFVSFILKRCGCKKNVFECGAQRMRAKCIKLKLMLDDITKGKANDIIFYDWNGDAWTDHVGIIYKSDKSYYYVVEGNKNKRVETRKISKKSKSIEGIARIK